jgi:hypothetical protein
MGHNIEEQSIIQAELSRYITAVNQQVMSLLHFITPPESEKFPRAALRQSPGSLRNEGDGAWGSLRRCCATNPDAWTVGILGFNSPANQSLFSTFFTPPV